MAPHDIRRKPSGFLADPMGAAPVFMHDFRVRMRRPWAYGVLLGYVLLLYPAGLYFLYRFAVNLPVQPTSTEGLEALRQAHQVAIFFTQALFAAQVGLISLLAPMLTCAGFAGERARRGLLFVLLTPLPSREIVAGKAAAALFFLVLLLLSTMPLCAISSLFGGISPGELLLVYAALIAYALLAVSFGLYISALTGAHVGRAALWTYLGTLLGAPALLPVVLMPFTGLYTLLAYGDSSLLLSITREAPISLITLVLIGVTLLGTRWLHEETVLRLDTERHQWGTFAPPLASPAPTEMPVPPPPDPHDHAKRRW